MPEPNCPSPGGCLYYAALGNEVKRPGFRRVTDPINYMPTFGLLQICRSARHLLTYPE